MANSRCHAFLHDDHFRVSMAVALLRLAHNKNKDIDEIVSLEGKACWDAITTIANEGTDELYYKYKYYIQSIYNYYKYKYYILKFVM